MDRSIGIVLNELLTDQNGVFIVVPAPRHEGHQNILAQRQFTLFSAWSVCQNLVLFDAVTLAHEGLLGHTGVLIGALELRQLVDINADVSGWAPLGGRHANDDTFCINAFHNSSPTAEDNCSRVASGNIL